MSGGAEAWRAVKPRPPSGEGAAGVDTLEATVDTAAGKGKRGRTSDPPRKIRGTPATLLAPPDFTNDGVGSSPASASWEERAMEAERLYLDNKRRRLDAPTETEAASPERPPAPRNLSFASAGGGQGGGQQATEATAVPVAEVEAFPGQGTKLSGGGGAWGISGGTVSKEDAKARRLAALEQQQGHV